MDWLRRNWPDLLIGIALIAVIAGIVATLLTGGSFFPLGSGQQGAPPSTPNVAPVAPAADPVPAPDGNGDPSAGVSGPEAPGVGTPGTTTTPATPDVSPETPQSELATPQTGSNGGAIAVLPPAPGQPSPSTPAPTSGSGQATTESPAPQENASAAGGTPQTATPTAPITSGATAPTAPYRVSVGAFGSEANAQAQAETFRQAGFPVFLGRQGELVLVLVGPYDTQGEAEQAVSEIRTGDFGIEPVIYRFQPDDAVEGDGVETPTPAAGTADAGPEAAPTETTAPPVAADGTFLQVGAYANRESALPQIQRLEASGFDVTERRESDLVKLLVGPYDDAALTEARARLQREGIESFPR